MKIRSGMLGVLMLTLLPLPLHAKEVYMAVVSEDMLTGVPNLDGLDAIIKTSAHDIDYYFANGNLTLQTNEQFILRGGRGSIERELDQYNNRSIILNTGGRNWLTLDAYGCYQRRPIGRENTTYVMVRSSLWPPGARHCARGLHAVNNGGTVIGLGPLSAAVKVMPKN